MYDPDALLQELGKTGSSWEDVKARLAEVYQRHIRNHESFGFETTFYTTRTCGVVRDAREAGFTTILWYMSVGDVSQLDKRIGRRARVSYRKYIDPKWMIPQYEASLKELPGYFPLFDWVGLWDASAVAPRIIGLIMKHSVHRFQPVPQWAADLMDRHESMSEEPPDNAKSGETKA